MRRCSGAGVMFFLGSLLSWSWSLSWSWLFLQLLTQLAFVCSSCVCTWVGDSGRHVHGKIFDVDIDKVNKPFLPVAAGQMSNRESCVCTSCCALGVLALRTAKVTLPPCVRACVCAPFVLLLRPGRAWVLVGGSAVVGPAIVGALFSPLIFKLYCFGLTIGALYSVPPFRLKRFPLAAGITIACVRGFLLNFGV